MGYLVTSFYSNWLTILQKLLGKIPPNLVLLYGNCTLIFKQFFLSKHSVLFPRLIDRCFITFFQQAFLTVTLSAKIIKNVLFLAFKIRKYDWLIDWLIDSFIHSLIQYASCESWQSVHRYKSENDTKYN